MSASDKLVELYRRWQESLARWGDTHASTEAFFRLADEIEANPFLDAQGFELVLEQLHVRAYPEANRPPRLHTGQFQSIIED